MEPYKFRTVLDDEDIQDKSKVKKIIVCSGQIYFDLLQKREELQEENTTAIIRLERIGPFPYLRFQKIISQYDSSAQVTFAQEEHLNFGAWDYVNPRMNLVLREEGFQPAKVASRAISSSTATGYVKSHKQQLERLLNKAFE